MGLARARRMKLDRWGWDSHRKKPMTVQGVLELPSEGYGARAQFLSFI